MAAQMPLCISSSDGDMGKCRQLPVPQPHSLMPPIILCTSKEMGFALKLVGVCICNLLNNVQFLVFCLFKGSLSGKY